MTYDITPENVTPAKMMSVMNDIIERTLKILKEKGVNAEIKTTHEGGKVISHNGPPALALTATAGIILQMVVNENFPLFLAEKILEKHGIATVEAELALMQQKINKK